MSPFGNAGDPGFSGPGSEFCARVALRESNTEPRPGWSGGIIVFGMGIP